MDSVQTILSKFLLDAFAVLIVLLLDKLEKQYLVSFNRQSSAKKSIQINAFYAPSIEKIEWGRGSIFLLALFIHLSFHL